MIGAGPAVVGLVTAFDEHAGLGTVTAHGVEYPFHCTQIADGSRSIPVGTIVCCTVGAGRQGRWEAAGVTSQ
ncbi:MAG: hypothetical protein M0Z30_04095 [Actinomycetota bacterium]|nr:hypothetical protein [Actinomycetota bacterium]